MPLRSTGGTLACEHGHEFPIVADIPRFVRAGSYAAAFGPQWLKYRQTQLDSFHRRGSQRRPCAPLHRGVVLEQPRWT
jgi:hypothetical protein